MTSLPPQLKKFLVNQDEFSIKPLEQEIHYQNLTYLYQEVLGKNYCTNTAWHEWIQPNWQTLGLFHQQTLIGGRIHKKAENLAESHYLLANLTGITYPHGLLKTSAILPEFQNLGFGQALTKHALFWLQNEKKVSTIYCVSWDNQTRNNSVRMLEAIGFHKITHLITPWKQQCNAIKNYCPNQTPSRQCTCNATVYKKRLTAPMTAS